MIWNLRMLGVAVSLLIVLPAGSANGQFRASESQIVDAATAVLQEIMAIPVNQIPQALLASAHAVAVFPNLLKGGFVIGVRHGRGVLLIRDDRGSWQPPSFVKLTGGSIGWQAGVQATDLILVFRTRMSLSSLRGGKLTLGVDAAAAAGPVGRQANAATDATLQAEILSYSRSRGLFAGVAVDGAVLQPDLTANAVYYQGNPLPNAEPTSSTPLNLPPSAVRLMNQLACYSGAPPSIPGPPVPAAAGPSPPASTPSAPSEPVRQQLAESAHRLFALLDQSWTDYLSLPREVFLPNQPPRAEDLKASLQRYDAVAADQKFAILNQRPEFAATHRMLREYVKVSTPQAAAPLTLPPPPKAADGQAQNPR